MSEDEILKESNRIFNEILMITRNEKHPSVVNACLQTVIYKITTNYCGDKEEIWKGIYDEGKNLIREIEESDKI